MTTITYLLQCIQDAGQGSQQPTQCGGDPSRVFHSTANGGKVLIKKKEINLRII